MAHATLQQLMTLSAGGLVLFFSFIAKAPASLGIELGGIVVVFAWIVSLCAAAYAHELHSELFLILTHVASLERKLDAIPAKVAEMISNRRIDPKLDVAIDRTIESAESQEKLSREALTEVENDFVKLKKTALLCIRISLLTLLFGFIVLGFSYAAAKFTT